MVFKILEGIFSACKLASGADVHWDDEYVFVAKSDEEYSLICNSVSVPNKVLTRNDGWRGFRIEGMLDFAMVGVLAEISKIIASAGVEILAVSSFNTDYFFVKKENFEKTQKALQRKGYQFV